MKGAYIMDMKQYRKGERNAISDIETMGLKWAMHLYELMEQASGIDPDYMAGYYQTVALEYGIC